MVARCLRTRERNEQEEGRRNRTTTTSGRRMRMRRKKNRRTVHRTSENMGRTSCLCCVYARRYTCVCVHGADSVQGRRTKSTMEGGRYRRADGQGGRGGWRDRERERDVAKQQPSPISILIELNATSYLMPETRQKLQLNGDAISLYLPVHSS